MRECPRKYFILIFHIFKKSKSQQFFLQPVWPSFRHTVFIIHLTVRSTHPSIRPTSAEARGQQGQSQDEQQHFLEPMTLLQSPAGALAADHLCESHCRGDVEELHAPLSPQHGNAQANGLRARVGAGKAPAVSLP